MTGAPSRSSGARAARAPTNSACWPTFSGSIRWHEEGREPTDCCRLIIRHPGLDPGSRLMPKTGRRPKKRDPGSSPG
ncbi:hypothetical protein E5675_11370 [Sphingopyxis sp. PAMC25046]|nr:hypothetical protein E5675_11370 [Sphingopyxis sp. PAMC25046]